MIWAIIWNRSEEWGEFSIKLTLIFLSAINPLTLFLGVIIMSAIALILFVGGALGTAVALFYGLRAVKLI
jgi:hypothetical protein